MSRIALVGDGSNDPTSVAAMLAAEGFEVETFPDAATALAAFACQMPDLAVLDIAMPDMDGITLLQRLRQMSHVPVMLLSARADEMDEVLALRMGADDYVRKPFFDRVLVERIRALLRRQAGPPRVSAPQALDSGPLRMDPSRHSVTWKGHAVALTLTEFLLLQALAQRPGFVRSRDQLAQVVYQGQGFADGRVIGSHIKRLRRKLLAVDAGFSAIETLYGVGYRYHDD